MRLVFAVNATCTHSVDEAYDEDGKPALSIHACCLDGLDIEVRPIRRFDGRKLQSGPRADRH